MTATESDATVGDLEELRRALNDCGVFAYLELLERIEKAGWTVCSDVRVSVAPCRFDLANGIKKLAGDESWVSSLSLQKSIADSQSESARRETVVDIVAIRRDRVFVGSANLDRNASWAFGRHSENRGFSALHKVASSENEDDLMHIPKADNNADSLSMRMKQCNPWTSQLPNNFKFSTRRYDHGMSLTADDDGKYSCKDKTIVEAARPILEGTFCLAMESLVRHVMSGRGYDVGFIPVIFTTASILACEYDEKSPSNTRLEERDAIIYDCPIPASVKFPNQVADFEDHKRMRRAVRWPVLVVNRRCLDRLFVDSVTACARM